MLLRRMISPREFTLGVLCEADPGLNRTVVLYTGDDTPLREILEMHLPAQASKAGSGLEFLAWGVLRVGGWTPLSAYVMGIRCVYVHARPRRPILAFVLVLAAIACLGAWLGPCLRGR